MRLHIFCPAEERALDDGGGRKGGGPGITEDGLEVFAPYLMNRILRRYNASVDRAVKEAGQTVPRLRALAALAAHGALTVNDLSVYSVAEQSSTSRLVEQMAGEALVTRRVSGEDSRVRLVELTDHGRTVFETVFPRMLEAEGQMLDGLGAGEREAFLATLRKILANVRQTPI
ncbi:MAG: MarR family winged helix-turn-helix transcriptional regulator [Pseudomonadota bacterium]